MCPNSAAHTMQLSSKQLTKSTKVIFLTLSKLIMDFKSFFRRAALLLLAVVTLPAFTGAQTIGNMNLRSLDGNDCFKVGVQRCYAQGNDVILELKFCNLTNQDFANCQIYQMVDIYKAYDNLGNVYNFAIKGQGDYSVYGLNFEIPADFALPIKVKINDVSPDATKIHSIKFNVFVGTGASTQTEKFHGDIVLRNLPIERD